MTLALGDSYGTSNRNASSISVVLTIPANSIVVVCVSNAKSGAYTTVSSVSGGSLTYSKRNSSHIALPSNYYGTEEIWTAYSSTNLGTTIVTATFAASALDVIGIGFVVTGVPSSDYWDTNGSLPASATGTSSSYPSTTISTSASYTFIFGSSMSYGSAGTAGSGFTLISGVTGYVSALTAEYQIATSTQSSLAVAFGTKVIDWVNLADAFRGYYDATITESGSASDSDTNIVTFVPSVSEAASASDSESGYTIMAPAVTEAASATDTESGPISMQVSAAEAAAAIDASDVTYHWVGGRQRAPSRDYWDRDEWGRLHQGGGYRA